MSTHAVLMYLRRGTGVDKDFIKVVEFVPLRVRTST
jgi:hypothetical protein